VKNCCNSIGGSREGIWVLSIVGKSCNSIEDIAGVESAGYGVEVFRGRAVTQLQLDQ
jgi:hypothetical protein